MKSVTTIDWQPLQALIEQHQHFVLSTHVRPDADAAGSELALAEILESMGKSVRIINPSGLPANLLFLDPDRRILTIGESSPRADFNCDVHIIVDTSAWAQLGKIGNVLKQSSAQKVVIDHHAVTDQLDALTIRDTSAEATGVLIFDFVRSLGAPISSTMANVLFCAIATDTGWFRFPSTKSRTFRVCAELIDCGAEPHALYHQLYEQASLARVKLAGRVLSRIALDCDGSLAYVCVYQKDFAETGAVPADTEDLVNECLRIAGTEGAFILVETPQGNIKASLRGRNNLDVARIAQRFGGGGHRQAAGVVLDGPMANALKKVLAAFREELQRKPCSSAQHETPQIG